MQRSRVLVVDDDPHTRDSVRDTLRAAGFDVVTANDGREALGRLLDEEQPAVIIMDVRMPGMDGRELLTVARAYHRFASIPVLVLTAFELSPQIVDSAEVVMRKPFRSAELVDTVQALASGGMRSAAE